MTKTNHPAPGGVARKQPPTATAIPPTPGSNAPVPFGDDRNAFLDMLADRLPPREQRARDRLRKVKACYVESGRDAYVADQLESFLAEALARDQDTLNDARIMIMTAPSGMGKSAAIHHALRNSPTLQPISTPLGVIDPVVSVNLSGPSTLKILGERILKQAGYVFRKKIDQGDLWEMIPEQLALRRVLVVHIDEIQHLIRDTEKQTERRQLANAIKDVVNYPDWPIAFILTGMPETINLAARDEQIERRSRYILFQSLTMPDERGLVVDIVRRKCAAGEIDPGEAILGKMPERIAHAANYRYGRCCEIVLAALHMAFRKDAAVLTVDHFAQAYQRHSHAIGYDDHNPFLVDDFLRLAQGTFLIEPETLA